MILLVVVAVQFYHTSHHCCTSNTVMDTKHSYTSKQQDINNYRGLNGSLLDLYNNFSLNVGLSVHLFVCLSV